MHLLGCELAGRGPEISERASNGVERKLKKDRLELAGPSHCRLLDHFDLPARSCAARLIPDIIRSRDLYRTPRLAFVYVMVASRWSLANRGRW